MIITIIESERKSKILFGRHCLCPPRLQDFAIKLTDGRIEAFQSSLGVGI